MQLTIVSSLFPRASDPLNGVFVQRQVAALARTELGPVHVVVPVDAPTGALDLPPQTSGQTVHYPAMPAVRGGARLEPWAIVPFLWWVLARRRGTIDLLHAHFAYPLGFAAAWVARVLHLPLVLTVHGSDVNVFASADPVFRVTRSRVAWTLRQCARVVCVSRPLAARAIQLGMDPARLRVIGNGVDWIDRPMQAPAAARRALALLTDEPLVLFVGRFKPVKRLDFLLDAMATVWHYCPSVRLVLVGDGPDRARLAKRVSQEGWAERVRFVGEQPASRVPDWLAAADVLVLSSASEGSPTVIPEAWACGRPVVSVAVGGVPDLLADTRLGLLADPNSPSDLAAKLLAALRAEWDSMYIRSSARRYTWDGIARQLLGVYREALE